MTQPVTAQQEAPTSAAKSAGEQKGSRRPWLRWDVHTLSLLGVLAVLVAVGGITAPDEFLATSNLQLVLTQASVIGVVTVLRRTVWRGRRSPWQAHGGSPYGERSPIAVLGRRFASGEIDEDEYWRRLSVLDEQFGRRLEDRAP